MQEVAAILSEIVFLLAGVEFENDVAGVHLRAGTRQCDDLQSASSDGRRNDRSRLGGAENSRRDNFELQIYLFDGRRWNLRIRRQNRSLAAREAASSRREGKEECAYS